MQAVILVAGNSTRTYPLTQTKPKPLLKVAGKTIIEHNLEQLSGLVDEVYIVVGYHAEMIKEFIGNEFEGMKIKYVVQEEAVGNADALKKVSGKIRDKFILMFGDDLYSREDIKRLLKCDNAILAQKVEDPTRFGVLKVDGDRFVEVVEKPKKFISDLVNIGCFLFDKDIFDALEKVGLSKRNEYELTDAYNMLAKKKQIKVVEVKDYWLPITYPWNLLDANSHLLKNLKTDKKAGCEIEKSAQIKGEIDIGSGTVIKSGVYIEGNVIIGKNCTIGPNCYLRGFVSIGNNCHIGQAVEIKHSIIGDNTNVAHLSYIGDSVIGDNVNIGAGSITSNLRFDEKNIGSSVDDNKQDTGRNKLGVIIGDNCKTGINVSFYPGVKIGAGKQILPGEIVKGDHE